MAPRIRPLVQLSSSAEALLEWTYVLLTASMFRFAAALDDI